MKTVLYLTNIEVPYRVKFFNELAKYCDLTVLYERRNSKNRNEEWAFSETSLFHKEYLDGFKIGNENLLSYQVIGFVKKKYDIIIIGCYNSPTQIMALFYMRMKKIEYYLNIDGETFIGHHGIKNWLKKNILIGASHYLVAGKHSGDSLQRLIPNANLSMYGFSSLYNAEIDKNRIEKNLLNHQNIVLVVGQFLDYKGLDIVVNIAKRDRSIYYRFVGTGNRTDEFKKRYHLELESNIEVVPFLLKEKLEEEYKRCTVLVLPSRKECWGMVINEAASFGTPIVSTYGSGAAIEFLADQYKCFLSAPDNEEDLYNKIKNVLAFRKKEEYANYLLDKTKKYSIENMVKQHCAALGINMKDDTCSIERLKNCE